MNDEKDRILKLLEEKKITADEAARLLDALNRTSGTGTANRFLKVKVCRQGEERARVNITVPMTLVRWGMNFMPDSAKAKIEGHDIDMKVVADALERGITGKIVDVQDEEKGEHIEVWLE